jgi:hypothetical protein
MVTIAAKSNTTDPRWRTVQPYNSKLERIAKCESHRHWFENTHNGYYGGLQFALTTWQKVGGRGYPHQNSILEQKYRAVLLMKTRDSSGRPYGYSPWPYCGRM